MWKKKWKGETGVRETGRTREEAGKNESKALKESNNISTAQPVKLLNFTSWTTGETPDTI